MFTHIITFNAGSKNEHSLGLKTKTVRESKVQIFHMLKYANKFPSIYERMLITVTFKVYIISIVSLSFCYSLLLLISFTFNNHAKISTYFFLN